MSSYKPTPNYQLMFESAVEALKLAYSEYKDARHDQLRWTFFDNDGNFCILDGFEERQKRIHEAEKEVARLKKEVEELRGKIGGDTK